MEKRQTPRNHAVSSRARAHTFQMLKPGDWKRRKILIFFQNQNTIGPRCQQLAGIGESGEDPGHVQGGDRVDEERDQQERRGVRQRYPQQGRRRHQEGVHRERQVAGARLGKWN